MTYLEKKFNHKIQLIEIVAAAGFVTVTPLISFIYVMSWANGGLV